MLIALAKAVPDSITGNTLQCFPPLLDSDLREIGSSELELGDGKKQVKLSWIWKAYGCGADASDSTNDSKSHLSHFLSWFNEIVLSSASVVVEESCKGT